MARPIIEASQKNRDNLLQILLYEKYLKYKEQLKIEEGRHYLLFNNVFPRKLLSFDKWLENILEEF